MSPARDERRQAVLGLLATHGDVRWHDRGQDVAFADEVLELAARLGRVETVPPPRPDPGGDRCGTAGGYDTDTRSDQRREWHVSELSEFLLARIAEDEEVAYNATWGSWSAENVWTDHGYNEWQIGAPDQDDVRGRPIIAGAYGPNSADDIAHMVRHDPARVLAECEAKHEIAMRLRAMEVGVLTRGGLDVAISELRQVCQFLALPYAEHPDYREEWRP